MALNQYAKTERDFTSLLNSANMSPADRDKLSAILASLVNTQTLVPGVEQQITDIETEIGDIVAAINNIKVPVWKMQVFDANGTFTVPDAIAGNVVYVTGSGGGGSGGVCIRDALQRRAAGGGFGGEFCVKRPLAVTAGDSIPVTIGAGAASVSITSATTAETVGLTGGNTVFGSITLLGGSGGTTTSNIHSSTQYGVFPSYFGRSLLNADDILIPPAQANGYSGGALQYTNVTQPTWALGGAAGAFGHGKIGALAVDGNATASSADANTGSGGAGAAVSSTTGVTPYTATSGAGGSGKIIVEWQEFA